MRWSADSLAIGHVCLFFRGGLKPFPQNLVLNVLQKRCDEPPLKGIDLCYLRRRHHLRRTRSGTWMDGYFTWRRDWTYLPTTPTKFCRLDCFRLRLFIAMARFSMPDSLVALKYLVSKRCLTSRRCHSKMVVVLWVSESKYSSIVVCTKSVYWSHIDKLYSTCDVTLHPTFS